MAAGFGLAVTKAIYALTNDMEQEEMRLLEVRRAAGRQRHVRTQVGLLAAMFIGLAVLIPGYWGFIVQSRARHQAERKLRDMADRLPAAAFQVRSAIHFATIFALSERPARSDGYDLAQRYAGNLIEA
jgi:NAD/NADP transhydrogenase beta subunit